MYTVLNNAVLTKAKLVKNTGWKLAIKPQQESTFYYSSKKISED